MLEKNVYIKNKSVVLEFAKTCQDSGILLLFLFRVTLKPAGNAREIMDCCFASKYQNLNNKSRRGTTLCNF